MRTVLMFVALALSACDGTWHGHSCFSNGTCGSGLVCLTSNRPKDVSGDPTIFICVSADATIGSYDKHIKSAQ